MRIPKEFYLKGKHWTVEYKWNLRASDGEKMDGLCIVTERVIQLDRAMPREEKWPVFLHELVHAIIFEAHISGLDGEAGEFIEEVICDAIAGDFDDLFNFRWKRRK